MLAMGEASTTTQGYQEVIDRTCDFEKKFSPHTPLT